MNRVYNEYLQEIKTKKLVVKVFLANKVMLEGKIIDFDNFGILLETKCFVIREQIASIALR